MGIADLSNEEHLWKDSSKNEISDMKAEKLIHDIIVLEEKITRCYQSAQLPVDEVRKLQKRQIKVVEEYAQSKLPSEGEINEAWVDFYRLFHNKKIMLERDFKGAVSTLLKDK